MIIHVFTILTSLLAFMCSAKKESFNFFMPDVTPHKVELSLCTAIKVSAESSQSIIGLVPHMPDGNAHSVVLYGCTKPGVTSIITDVVWDCGIVETNEKEPVYTYADVCKSGLQIIYPAWASDTKGIELPNGVGFLVGLNSDIKYLVLQVHYENKLSDVDDSGVTIYFTTNPMPNRAAVLVLGADAFGLSYYTAIWRREDELVSLETACTITEKQTIYPFAFLAFLTHSHALVKVMSGYVVKKNVTGDIWYLLGENDPPFSTSFRPVLYDHPITTGDILAARCILSNDRVALSALKNDVFNFYLMYAVKHVAPLKQNQCISPGPPTYNWLKAKEDFNTMPVKTLTNGWVVNHSGGNAISKWDADNSGGNNTSKWDADQY